MIGQESLVLRLICVPQSDIEQIECISPFVQPILHSPETYP